MSEDFQTLLQRRDERRAAAPDEQVDSIVVDRFKNQMVCTLRRAIDELETVDCAQKPGLAARVDAELAWIRAVITAFAGPSA
jgi:hypothetical protein